MQDPLLSARGYFKAIELGNKIKCEGGNVKEILSCPTKRCMDTSTSAFGYEIQNQGVRLVARADLQNFGKGPNDTGANKTDLIKHYGGQKEYWKVGEVDVVTHVADNWNDPAEKEEKGEWSLGNRSAKLRDLMAYVKGKALSSADESPAPEIMIVNHGSWMATFLPNSSKFLSS
jgi:broad specificity phosphatase PhoE